MISIEQALELIEEHSRVLPTDHVPLPEALGCCLAADAISDVDSPPFDKSMMDGFAVRSADIQQTSTRLDIVETITAGDVPERSIVAGTAAKIMTGSPMPHGADTVVMVEKSTTVEDGTAVLIDEFPIQPEQNVMRQGECLRQGQVILRAGTQLSAAHIGLLAEIGVDPVPVVRRPTVAVLSTGNELVSPAAKLRPGQIRNSNGPLLSSLARALGATVQPLGIVGDVDAELATAIQRGLQADVLVISGGVSAGIHDLVPACLLAAGVNQVFHKVALKPGKPVWFGQRTAADSNTLVFGLPGNPVSSLVCFHLFIRPTLQRIAGVATTDGFHSGEQVGRLQAEWRQSGRTTLYPATRAHSGDSILPTITLLPWKGSADLRTVADADCLAELPAGTDFAAGDEVRYYPLRPSNV